MPPDASASLHAIARFCEAHADDTLRTIETLVRLESPSLDKAAVDGCGAALCSMLRDAGCTVDQIRQPDRGDHVVARLEGSGRPIMLLGHFDTVWPGGILTSSRCGATAIVCTARASST
jgi:glutamate carboxypeptidase